MNFDQKWFTKIKTVNAQLPTRLKTTSHFVTKKQFLQDVTKEPVFEYGSISDPQCTNKNEVLDELESDIFHCKQTLPVVKELYLKKIVEKRNQLRLIAVLQKSLLHVQAPDLLTEARALSEEIYGVPNQDIFNHIVNRIRKKLSNDWVDLQKSDSYKRLQQIFPVDVSTTVNDINIEAEYDDSGAGNIIYTEAQVLARRFQSALRVANLNEWKVRINESKTAVIRVWPRNRYISIPNDRILKNRSNPVTEHSLQGLIAHEVMVHAVRVERGHASGLSLLAIGLDKYWKGEEGVATYYEQKVTGAEDYAGFLPYLTIGLAYGLDRDGEPRTFSQVFAILVDYHALDSHGKNLDAETLAFLSCTRVFKGNSAFALTRDCIYRAGNISVHELLRTKQLSDQYLNAGKYDPTNADHIRCLSDLGILPIT